MRKMAQNKTQHIFQKKIDPKLNEAAEEALSDASVSGFGLSNDGIRFFSFDAVSKMLTETALKVYWMMSLVKLERGGNSLFPSRTFSLALHWDFCAGVFNCRDHPREVEGYSEDVVKAKKLRGFPFFYPSMSLSLPEASAKAKKCNHAMNKSTYLITRMIAKEVGRIAKKSQDIFIVNEQLNQASTLPSPIDEESKNPFYPKSAKCTKRYGL